ncbi:hypothetical protein ACVRXF_10405 [Streptococcus orisasini]
MFLNNWLMKRKVISLLTKLTVNYVSAYCSDHHLYLVAVGRKFNTVYEIKLGHFEFDFVSDFLGEDDQFLIYDGQIVSELVDFLFYSRRKWRVINSYLID